MTTDGDLVEYTNIIDQNIQYSNERIFENAQMITVEGESR